MITTSPITGKDAVTLPIRRAVATFTNRAGQVENVTLNLTPSTDEAKSVLAAKSAIVDLLQVNPEDVRCGDKVAGAYPVYVAPATNPSGSFTLE